MTTVWYVRFASEEDMIYATCCLHGVQTQENDSGQVF